MSDMKSHITEPLFQAARVIKKKGEVQRRCNISAAVQPPSLSITRWCMKSVVLSHPANTPQLFCVSIIGELIQYGLRLYDTNFILWDFFF